jgi:ferredoxin, 2Fe-2S
LIKFYSIQNGEKKEHEASIGDNLMLALGIMGDCGGECLCATCHVQIDDIEYSMVLQDEFEKITLDIEANVDYNSRLSCQITVDERIENKTVRVLNNAILY